MNPDNKLGRIPTLAAAAAAVAVGVAGVGSPGVMASSEGQFQAIVQPGLMPARLKDPVVVTESAEASQEATPQAEVFLTIRDRVNLESAIPYFFTLYERLFGNPSPYFRISYAITDENYYTRVEASYFHNGGSAVIREGTIPDVHTVRMFPDGDGFQGSTQVDLLIKPDGTLGSSDLFSNTPISSEQIKKSIGEYFILPNGWEDMDWDETEEGLVIKRVKYRDAYIVIGGFVNGVIFSYFEPLIPDDMQIPDPSPSPTPSPGRSGGSSEV